MIKSKAKIAVLSVAMVCMAFSFAACGGDKTLKPCAEHAWNDGVVTSQATCGNYGTKTYTCAVCSQTKAERISPTGQHSGDVCSVCGYVDMSKLTKENAIATYGYYHEDVDGSKTVNLNDKIWFGSYPQQQVEDSAIVATLNSSVGASWTSYGYYVSGQKSDVMSYQDVTVGGNKYRGVKIDDYRPYYTDMASTENYIEGNGFTKGNVYWFEFSPIEWRVLDNDDGTVMLNSVNCLDGQSFNNTYDKNGTQYFNKGTQVYSNDWENSYIRDWLNSSFTNWAFTAEEQSKLVAQTLDNKNSSYDAESTYATTQNNTTDKVYLLSYSDLYNSDYGFPDVTNANHTSLNDATVCKEGTAYSHSQGARASVQAAGSWWMLRTAGGKSFSVCGLSKYGDITKSNTVTYPVTVATDGICFYTAEGISPVINIKIGK